MEVKPGYKQSEVGVIPKDWNTCRLGEVGKWFSGGTPSMSNTAYWGGDIPWISAKDMKVSRLHDSQDHITPKAITDGARLVPPGTVLMVIRGMILAHTFPVARAECPLAFNQDLKAVVAAEQIDSTYLLFWLMGNAQFFLGLTTESTHGTKRLPPETLFRVPFPLPRKAEQEAIAEALSDADAHIESLEQLIVKKRQIKQGAMQELLTGKRRLPGFEVKPGFKQTEVGSIPQDWDTPSLESILKTMQLGGNYKNSERESNWPLIKMGNMGRGYINCEKLEFVDSTQSPLQRDKLKQGDVLFNTRNTLDLVGKVSIWNEELPNAYFNSNIMRLEFDEAQVSSKRYMNYILNTSLTLRNLRGMAIGTTSVAAIYTRDLVKLKVPLPGKPEQSAIAIVLTDMDTEIAALEDKIAKARDIKQGMMQELLTGRVRLV